MMILLALFLVVLNGFFVATEFAIVKVRATRIRELVDKGNARARVAEDVVSRLDAYLSACQLGITLASLALGWIGEPAFAHVIEGVLAPVGAWAEPVSHVIAVTTAFVIITMLHIVLGELAPKSVAIRYAETTTLWVAGPIRLFYRIFYPFIWALNGLANSILRLIGLPPATESEVGHSEEELRLLLAESTGGGAAGERRRVLIEQALDFPTRRVREIMVPRADIAYLDITNPLREILDNARREGYTRYPLCRDHLDEVLGVIHVRELFSAAEGLEDSSELARLARPALFVPESATADQLLRLIQGQRQHLAIVVDEYGGTSGLATLEDVLEELTGEILDEFDVETPPIEEVADGTLRVAGSLPVADLARRLDLDIASEDAVTVGGLILEELGRVARTGDLVRVGEVGLRVLDTRSRRVVRVLAGPYDKVAAVKAP